jgi:E3 ubiquitin-protein ligase RGLG
VNAIEDRFQNLDEVSAAIKEAGLDKSQLIFGIDFTISNLENGAHTFDGRSLHFYDDTVRNPYQKVSNES